jgi:hypothetical protein
VRDPLSHFVSAYTEASTRMHMKRLRKGAKFKPCTIKTFMNFLEKLLTGSIRSILRNEAYHLYPMSELAIDQPRVRLPHETRVLLNSLPTRVCACDSARCHATV